jgi:hypothetical protein
MKIFRDVCKFGLGILFKIFRLQRMCPENFKTTCRGMRAMENGQADTLLIRKYVWSQELTG